MCWSFTRSMVPATISSVVMILVARIYVARVYVVASVVMVSVARIYVARIYVARMCVARICVVEIYVARVYADVCRFSRCSLVDRRFEVEVMSQPRRHSRRREGRARGRCISTAPCCEVRGVASLQELRQSCMHLLDTALLHILVRAGRPSQCCSLSNWPFLSPIASPASAV